MNRLRFGSHPHRRIHAFIGTGFGSLCGRSHKLAGSKWAETPSRDLMSRR